MRRQTRVIPVPNRQIFVVYRLLTVVPIEVHFPSITYRVDWSLDQQSRSLVLLHANGSSAYVIKRFQRCMSAGLYSNAEAVFTDEDVTQVYNRGFDVQSPGVIDTVLRRLVRDRRAEVISGPHCRFYIRGIDDQFALRAG